MALGWSLSFQSLSVPIGNKQAVTPHRPVPKLRITLCDPPSTAMTCRTPTRLALCDIISSSFPWPGTSSSSSQTQPLPGEAQFGTLCLPSDSREGKTVGRASSLCGQWGVSLPAHITGVGPRFATEDAATFLARSDAGPANSFCKKVDGGCFQFCRLDFSAAFLLDALTPAELSKAARHM